MNIIGKEPAVRMRLHAPRPHFGGTILVFLTFWLYLVAGPDNGDRGSKIGTWMIEKVPQKIPCFPDFCEERSAVLSFPHYRTWSPQRGASL